MRSVAYASVLTQVYSLLNLVAADVTAADKTKLNAFIQRRAREAFQKHWWAETMRSEERWFRGFYATGTTYAAPTATTATEVFHPGSKGYFQALRAGTGNAPATFAAGSWTTNTAYWAPIAENYTGQDWADATVYAVGDVVYYASATSGYEGDYWLCLTATSAGQDPEDTPAKWQRQEIPEALRDAIAHAAYSDYLRPVGKDGAVPLESTAGGQFLTDELFKAVAMQRQAGRWAQG